MSNFINRQDAINAVTEVNMQVYEGNAAVGRRLYLTQDEMIAIIESLPFAELERKKGKWINGRCDQCGEHAPFWAMASTYYLSNFCQNCGADMRGE